jgi:hypothetical protein
MTSTAAPDLVLDGVTEQALSQIAERLLSADFDRWAAAAARVGHCSQPVRLTGSSVTVDTSSGEVLSRYDSAYEQDGFTRIRCGNRRASVCPSCSREYAGDTWHLIASGAAGGKGVPETVATHPMVFATVTAPSFGPVHTMHKHSDGQARPCRPRRNKQVCEHGRTLSCGASHDGGDELAGQPLCADCYDYKSHVVWQWHAPELWRRFTIALRRSVARALGVPASRLNERASVQFAKVGEFQRRGVIHFHALVRVDGPKQKNQSFTEPPAGFTADMLSDLVLQAARHVEVVVPGVDDQDRPRLLRFGSQIDARAITTSTGTETGELSPAQVAGYIAKYATKSAQDSDFGVDTSPHLRRLRGTVAMLAERATADDLQAVDAGGEPGPYELLGKWIHMLGFRGHFSSKSRQYSTTLGALRGARRAWQLARHAANRPGHEAAADTDTTLVIGRWRFVGIGWRNEGETLLAEAAAARAREQQRERAATTSRREREFK